jgi:hypothetical protein
MQLPNERNINAANCDDRLNDGAEGIADGANANILLQSWLDVDLPFANHQKTRLINGRPVSHM